MNLQTSRFIIFYMNIEYYLKIYRKIWSKNLYLIILLGLSRGRGIACFNNLVEIIDYVKSKET